MTVSAEAVPPTPPPDMYARFAELHRIRLLRDAQPLGRGQPAPARAPRLPGRGHDELGLGVVSRAAGQRPPVEAALAHLREMAAVSPVPVNGDFEGGFAVQPEGVAVNVASAATTGVAGLSIEDSTGDAAKPLFDFALAVERVRAARHALDTTKSRVLLTARSEGFIVGRPELAETLRRLEAYAEAGADCLYAPGIRTRAEIGAVVRAVSPKPVNVLVGGDFTTVADLAELGVRRISVGGALARAAWTGFLQAAREIAEDGTFARLGEAIPFADVNAMFPRE